MDDNRETIYCIGRFKFSAPLLLALTGRSQSIYRTDVSTVALPEEGIEALWQTRLTRIRAFTPPGGVAGSVIRTFELQPGLRAVWYYSSPGNRGLRCLEAIKAVANHALIVSRSVVAGKEAVVETLVKNVLDAYIPTVVHGFCVGYGSVTSEPGVNESAGIALNHRAFSELELRIDTQTVKEPDTWSYSDLDEERELTESQGGKLEILLNQTRSAAGLKGTEIWASFFLPREKPMVRFTWHFAGVPGDSSRPMINIKGTATKEQQAELEFIWEVILKSLRAVPISPGA